MKQYPYILFNKTPEQLRRLGARGGKAQRRNQRARRDLLPAPMSPPLRPLETAAEASARLDEQFPWLRGAEQRCTPPNPRPSIPTAL